MLKRSSAPPLPVIAVNMRCPAWQWNGWPPLPTANEYSAVDSPLPKSVPARRAEGSSSASRNCGCARWRRQAWAISGSPAPTPSWAIRMTSTGKPPL
ncbi:hypothetical protein [Xanthomonas sacchari]|uniref:hypothetical protein n=1 Tax=Xanthomonas sacchari TaxID=56458 RepID=UPI00225B5E98|nr:hypothetical protein [Xanthomonas sacchari]UYK74119.1 hypothetical protein NG828_07325 [Xanthomonas sacchari]